MYSFKEKKIYFNDLRNADAAEIDVSLLQSKLPAHPEIEVFLRSSKRYSDQILYLLLDCATREEIREFRRSSMAGKENADSGNIETLSDANKLLEDAPLEQEKEMKSAEQGFEEEKKKERLKPVLKRSKSTKNTRK